MGWGAGRACSLCEGRVTALPGTLSKDQVGTQQWVINTGKEIRSEEERRLGMDPLAWLEPSVESCPTPGLALSCPCSTYEQQEGLVSPKTHRTVAPEHLFLIWVMSHVINRKLLIQWSCF